MALVGEHGTGNREVEPHEVPPEIEQVELWNEEPRDEEPENIEYSQSPHSSVPEDPYLPENVPEVSTPTAPLHANILDSSTGYVLPFRHNCWKPPNRYNPDEEERKSKYPITNYVFTQGLSKPLKTFTQTLSSCHIPSSVEEALSDPEWAQAMQEELKALKKNNTWKLVPLPERKKLVVQMSVLYKIQGWWINWPIQGETYGKGFYPNTWHRLLRNLITSS